MLDRLLDMSVGFGHLIRAEGTALLDRAGRVLFWGGAALACGLAVVAAAAGLLVALGAVLASEVGWIGALAITCGAALVLAIGVWLMARAAMARSVQPDALPLEHRAEIAGAKEEMKGHGVDGHSRDAKPDATGPWQDRLIRYVRSHPGAAVGAAACALALLGPARTIRLMGRGAMLAGLMSSILDTRGDARAAGAGSNGRAGRTPARGSGASGGAAPGADGGWGFGARRSTVGGR